ncbi:MAG: methylmalonyl Co-A mutase-associated GTPase MeaB [Bacteroidales bacterium]|nr:methylmalonyl Co-A mutase-associated GTPase MeaB [Bacteroidales bacterium]
MGSKKLHNTNSAIKINTGVSKPCALNTIAANKYKSFNRRYLSVDEYTSGILRGDRAILSKAITLIESSLLDHQANAQELIKSCLPYAGNSIRIGITGVPGVGKSTFIESMGKFLIKNGRKIAVLAIDPSSSKTNGSILGDKTRMEELSKESNAFIRPTPSSGSLGGVARKTRESIILCEAAGFDTIIVETVGVGQSETEVHSMVDFFLLLMLAGAGDELQGIKRGIMEMADAIIIHKADGDNINRAQLSLSEIKNAIHLFHPSESGWITTADHCSSLTNDGIDRIWNTILEYINVTKSNNFFFKHRSSQSLRVFHQALNQKMIGLMYDQSSFKRKIKQKEEEVSNGKQSAYTAAQELFEMFVKEISV